MIGKTKDEKYVSIIKQSITKGFKHIKESLPLLLMCFFLSRHTIIGEIFPFALIVLSIYCHAKGPWFSILAVSIAGIMSVRFDFAYLVMLTAIYGYYYAFKDEGKSSIFLAAGYTAAVLFFFENSNTLYRGI